MHQLLNRFGGLALALTFFAFSPAAHATTLVLVPFDALVEASDAVVHGTVTAIEYTQRDGIPVTIATVQVTADWLDATTSTTVEIVALGGMEGTLRTRVFGAETYQVGEEVVVFGHALPDGALQSVAMSYSKYRVTRDTAQPVAVRHVDAAMVPGPGMVYRLLPPMLEVQAATRLEVLERAVRDVAEVQR